MNEVVGQVLLVWFTNLLYRALVLMLLWNWYIPITFNTTHLSYFVALGICLIAEALRSSENDTFKATEKDPLVIGAKLSMWWSHHLDTTIILVLGFVGTFFL